MEDYFQQVLQFSWQEKENSPPTTCLDEVRSLYPGIDVYIKHWMSLEFWDSVIFGAMTLSALYNKQTDQSPFDKLIQNSLCSDTLDLINGTIARFAEARGWHITAKGTETLFSAGDQQRDGEMESAYSLGEEAVIAGVTYTFRHQDFTHSSPRKAIRLLLHETRHLLQLLYQLPSHGQQESADLDQDIVPEEIDARFYQECVWWFFNSDDSLPYTCTVWGTLHELYKKFEEAGDQLNDNGSFLQKIAALTDYLQSDTFGKNSFFFTFSRLLLNRCKILQSIHAVRLAVNPTYTASDELLRCEKSLLNLEEPVGNQKYRSAIFEYFGYVYNRLARWYKGKERQEYYSKAVNHFYAAAGCSHGTRLTKYIAMCLYEFDPSDLTHVEISYQFYIQPSRDAIIACCEALIQHHDLSIPVLSKTVAELPPYNERWQYVSDEFGAELISANSNQSSFQIDATCILLTHAQTEIKRLLTSSCWESVKEARRLSDIADTGWVDALCGVVLFQQFGTELRETQGRDWIHILLMEKYAALASVAADESSSDKQVEKLLTRLGLWTLSPGVLTEAQIRSLHQTIQKANLFKPFEEGDESLLFYVPARFWANHRDEQLRAIQAQIAYYKTEREKRNLTTLRQKQEAEGQRLQEESKRNKVEKDQLDTNLQRFCNSRTRFWLALLLVTICMFVANWRIYSYNTAALKQTFQQSRANTETRHQPDLSSSLQRVAEGHKAEAEAIKHSSSHDLPVKDAEGPEPLIVSLENRYYRTDKNHIITILLPTGWILQDDTSSDLSHQSLFRLRIGDPDKKNLYVVMEAHVSINAVTPKQTLENLARVNRSKGWSDIVTRDDQHLGSLEAAELEYTGTTNEEDYRALDYDSVFSDEKIEFTSKFVVPVAELKSWKPVIEKIASQFICEHDVSSEKQPGVQKDTTSFFDLWKPGHRLVFKSYQKEPGSEEYRLGGITVSTATLEPLSDSRATLHIRGIDARPNGKEINFVNSIGDKIEGAGSVMRRDFSPVVDYTTDRSNGSLSFSSELWEDKEYAATEYSIQDASIEVRRLNGMGDGWHVPTLRFIGKIKSGGVVFEVYESGSHRNGAVPKLGTLEMKWK